MEKIKFNLFDNSDAYVEGYIHSPITEMGKYRTDYPAVVVCPGGGYEMLSQREADPVAFKYLAAGYNVFILYYSVGSAAKDLAPLMEASEALCVIREHAKEWCTNPDQIAICGFSAGGHLAASLGTLWNHERLCEAYKEAGLTLRENKPNAMILSYAVILAEMFMHKGSIDTVSGGASPESRDYKFFSLEQHVGEHTPPAFIWHTVTDDVVPVENSIAMISALQQNRISYEAHLFPEGPHGISVASKEVGSLDDYNARWMPLSIEWLNREFNYTP